MQQREIQEIDMFIVGIPMVSAQARNHGHFDINALET